MQQQAMTDNRNMLTEKELLYIQDYLSWELLAMKKCGEILSQTTDPDIRATLEYVGSRHRDHYESLLNHLQ
jgi:hypothetical protein